MRLGEMSWTALGKRLKQGPLDVMIPLGALEQHGPHLPLDTRLPHRRCSGRPGSPKSGGVRCVGLHSP